MHEAYRSMSASADFALPLIGVATSEGIAWADASRIPLELQIRFFENDSKSEDAQERSDPSETGVATTFTSLPAGTHYRIIAGNNPINASDPYGLTNWWQVGSGFVEAGGAAVALSGAAFGEAASAGIGTPAALGLYFVAAPALAHGTVQIITGFAAKNDVTVPAVSLPALGAYVYTRGNQSSGDIPDLLYSAGTTLMGLGNWSRISDAASNVLGLLGTAGSAYSLYNSQSTTVSTVSYGAVPTALAPGNSSATDANNAAGLLLRGSTGTYNSSAPSVPLTYTAPTSSADDSAAAGGYLIYPNKPNTNMTQSVYSK